MIFLIGEGGEEDGRSQVYSLSANSLVLVFNKTIKAVAIWYSLRRIQFVRVGGIMLLSSQKALPRPNMLSLPVDQFVKVLETTPMRICVSPCSLPG